MTYIYPSAKYSTLEKCTLKKVNDKKVDKETERQNEKKKASNAEVAQNKIVEASALDIIAKINLGTVDGLSANKVPIADKTIDPGLQSAISELEALINRWNTENENLSYDEKIELLSQIIDCLNTNSETFEADNRKWRTIRHTVYVQHRYEYYQEILDDPNFNPETFDWSTVEWGGGAYFPDETTLASLYANGDQFNLPSGFIVFTCGDDLIYNYHEQMIYHEYIVNNLEYSIAYNKLALQMPGLTNGQQASLQQYIEQDQATLENNLLYLQNANIGSEYEDKVAEWETNSSNMTQHEKIALVNEILNLLGQMDQDLPVTAAIARWSKVLNSLINAPQQQSIAR